MKQNIYAWAALGVRSFGALLLLVIASNSYSEREMAIWLVLQILAALQAVFDFGISPTILRFTIYALNRNAAPSAELDAVGRERLVRLRALPFERFQTYVRTLYLLIAGIAFIVTVLLGLFAMRGLFEDHNDGGPSAFVLLVISAAGNACAIFLLNYATYLNARKQVTLLKKAETVLGIGALLVPLGLILVQANLVIVVSAVALGKIVMVLGVRRLSIQQAYRTERLFALPRAFVGIILPQTMRTGIAIAASTGVLQVSALLLARKLSAADATIYLFGLRILYTVAQFSNVPFYTRLPYLIGKFVEGERAGLFNDAQRLILTTMTLQISISLLAYGVLDITAQLGLHRLGVMPALQWVAIAAILSVERLSSMYSQLRSLNNRIDWHILNVVNGILTLGLMALLLVPFGTTGFLIGLGLPILAFHLPYSTIRLLTIFPDSAALVRRTMLFCCAGLALATILLSLIQ